MNWLRRALDAVRQGGAAGVKSSGSRMQATWNGAVIADSDRAVVVEGNHYFPRRDVDPGRIEPSAKQTTCPWKGVASYYDIVVDGERNAAAAWYYPEPSPAAAAIKDHVAFWGGVRVEPV